MPLNKDFYIGFDGGGTKTVCILGDANGNIKASSVGESTNLKSRPAEKVREVIHELISNILEMGDWDITDIKGVFVSTAGGDRNEDQIRWKMWLVECGLKEERIIVQNDALAALAAGTGTNKGAILIAGTGSIAYLVSEKQDSPIRVGGWGYLMGDEGSGYDIGNKALRMVLRSHDGRIGNITEFSYYILEKLGLERPDQLVTFIYENAYPRKVIASTAKHVISLAEQGNIHAIEIVQKAIQSLVELVAVLNSKCEKVDFPLVVSGGLFESTYFRSEFERELRDNGYNLSVIFPKYPPVVGSYICSLLQKETELTEKMERNILESWNNAMNVIDLGR